MLAEIQAHRVSDDAVGTAKEDGVKGGESRRLSLDAQWGEGKGDTERDI